MNIATSVCVDDARHPASNYAQLLDVSAEKRRHLYWQCALVFFATSVRCNPSDRHIFYTNDTAATTWQGTDYRAFLRDLGVEIVELPFVHFQPPPRSSTYFRNGFYKLEVLRALANLPTAEGSVLLDSDCVWVRQSPEVRRLVSTDALLLLNVLPDSGPDEEIEGLSRRGLGTLFREIYPDYPTPVPVHYGGELVGGRPERLRWLVQELESTWQHVLRSYPTTPPRLMNQETLFDNDEYMTNLVYNRLTFPLADARAVMRRIWTSHTYQDVRPSDAALTIWHLPSEKLQGLPVLCRLVLNPASDFWRVPTTELSQYLGQYLGVVGSRWHPRRLRALATKLPRVLTVLKRLLKPRVHTP